MELAKFINKEAVSLVTDATVGFIKKHAPEILTGLGIASFVSTVRKVYKLTPKYKTVVENMEIERCEKLTTSEKVKTGAKIFAPAIFSGAMSVACFLSSNVIQNHRNAVLTAGIIASEDMLRSYQKETEALVGKEKADNIEKLALKDTVVKNPPKDEHVINTGHGDDLFIDKFSGRYFRSDMGFIKRAVADLNNQLIDESCVTLNDLYCAIGLEPVDAGEQFGWMYKFDGLIDVTFPSAMVDYDMGKSIMCMKLNCEHLGDF